MRKLDMLALFRVWLSSVMKSLMAKYGLTVSKLRPTNSPSSTTSRALGSIDEVSAILNGTALSPAVDDEGRRGNRRQGTHNVGVVGADETCDCFAVG